MACFIRLKNRIQCRFKVTILIFMKKKTMMLVHLLNTTYLSWSFVLVGVNYNQAWVQPETYASFILLSTYCDIVYLAAYSRMSLIFSIYCDIVYLAAYSRRLWFWGWYSLPMCLTLCRDFYNRECDNHVIKKCKKPQNSSTSFSLLNFQFQFK